MKRIKIFQLALGCFVILMTFSCKKFVEIPPSPTQIMNYKVFENDGTATRAVIGIYIQMIGSNNLFTSGNATLYPSLSADELSYYSNDWRQEFIKNEITTNNHDLISAGFWSAAYKYIYASNACIEGLEKSQSLTPSVKRSLTGEAKFIRAYCYFYLVNLFGDVPLITTTNYEVNSVMPRTAKSLVYDQIVVDLRDAQILLDQPYPTSERVRPNKWTATALLARTYLYMEEWANAAEQASMIIVSGIYSLTPNLDNVFLKSSNETIFQLQPASGTINTWEGNVILPATNTAMPTYLLTDTLLNSFETGDIRKASWIKSRSFNGQTYYYPFKYKVHTSSALTEYYVYLRLAEQYLIRAEAKSQLNDIVGAQADLNTIRNRAGLANTTANDKTSLLLAIEHERQVELFAEWGHRWFDLKRTNRVNAILSALKPSTWQGTDALWPIPITQMNLNASLTQNPGY
jgi:hypothetical protein